MGKEPMSKIKLLVSRVEVYLRQMECKHDITHLSGPQGFTTMYLYKHQGQGVFISALDYKTDRILRSELNKRTKDVTKLIVAQRISTIMDADHILVLDQGKVVGQGTHKELLVTNKVNYLFITKRKASHFE